MFDKYRISEALMGTYKLVWDDFCSWFLEMIKRTNSQLIAWNFCESDRNAGKQPESTASFYAVFDRNIICGIAKN
jgi:valyl-tRNA synthetase